MQVLKAGALYFALVFGAGFVLGVVRTLVLLPLLGERTAELMEAPVMLVVIVLAARWTVRRLAIRPRFLTRLAVGLVGLALVLWAESAVVLWVRGVGLDRYLAGRDAVAVTVYLVLLAVFAVMPVLVARRRERL